MKKNKGWDIQRLSDLGEIVTGNTPSKKQSHYYGGDIPWAKPSDLNRFEDILSTEEYLSSEGAKHARILPPQSVLVSCIGNLGKVGVAGRPMATNQQINAVIFNEKIYPRYGYYACRRLQRILEHYAPATTLPIVTKSRFSELKIPVPPFFLQQKIASILFTVQSALEKRRQTLRLADDFLKSAFLEMFGEPGANSKRFDRKSIKKLVKDIRNEDPRQFPDKQYSYVDISSVDNQLKEITEIKSILGADAPSRARQLLQAQDILVSTVRPNLNAVANLSKGLNNSIGSTGFCVLRADKELVQPEYLFAICKTVFFIKSLVNIAKGASYPAVSNNDILRLLIPVPSVADQQKFADLVQKVERLKEKQKQSEIQLTNLFSSLMQRAFKEELV